mgnify:FL=1
MSQSDRILAQLARKGGGKLLDGAVKRLLPDRPVETGKRGNLLRGIAGTVALRVATRSVPGAIVVASGALAKTLYDRRRARTRGAAQKAGSKA